jgi:ABC-type Mn2+/Zn2+ transport system permease subunit
MDPGLRLQFRLHSYGQSALSHHRLAGVVGAQGLQQMVWTNIIVKALVTALVFWTILSGAGKANLRGELKKRKRTLRRYL